MTKKKKKKNEWIGWQEKNINLQYINVHILFYPNKPYINEKLIYSAFRLCINLHFYKLNLMTGFEVQGHINVTLDHKNSHKGNFVLN